MIKLTYNKAVRLLKEAVADKGSDYVYPDEERVERYATSDEPGFCRYFLDDGTPSCIVGHVLYRAGYRPDSRTPDFEGDGVRALNGRMFLADPRTVRVLAVAQEAQDRGATWGKALNYALEVDR